MSQVLISGSLTKTTTNHAMFNFKIIKAFKVDIHPSVIFFCQGSSMEPLIWIVRSRQTLMVPHMEFHILQHVEVFLGTMVILSYAFFPVI